MRKVIFAIVFLFTYAMSLTGQVTAEEHELSIQIKNDETVKRTVYIYGKTAGVETEEVNEGVKRIHFTIPRPSTALLPNPVTILPGETASFKLPIPEYAPLHLPDKGIRVPVYLYQLDFRIQYWCEWCRLQFPFNNEISRIYLMNAASPYPVVPLTTTTRQIGQGVSSIGFWTT